MIATAAQLDARDAPLPDAPRDSAFSADAIRLPAVVARQLAAASPEALAALCRVLWFARVSGECFAKTETLRAAGVSLSAPVLRRGLCHLRDTGLLILSASQERASVTYRPGPALHGKARRSVFIPPEVWRGCKPTELAVWAMWRLSHDQRGAADIAAQVSGRVPGSTLSRSRVFAVFRTLAVRGLMYGPSPENAPGQVLKTTPGESSKRPTNADPSKSDLPNNPSLSSFHCSCGSDRAADGGGVRLVSLPAEQPSEQLSFTFGGSLRLVSEVPVSRVFIDWLEAAPPLPGAANDSSAGNTASGPTQTSPTSCELTLPHAWRKLAAIVPELQSPGFVSATGLPRPEESRLVESFRQAQAGGFAAEDVLALSGWILAGQIHYITAKRKYICDHLCTCLLDAKTWRASGRPEAGRRGGKTALPAQYLADAERTDAQSRDGAFIDRQIADGGFGGED